MSRGMLNDAVKSASQKLLGYEITTRELRLMPYIDYTLKNSQQISLSQISDEEYDIFKQWQEKGFITGSLHQVKVSKPFYDAMQEILWISYVTYNQGE